MNDELNNKTGNKINIEGGILKEKAIEVMNNWSNK